MVDGVAVLGGVVLVAGVFDVFVCFPGLADFLFLSIVFAVARDPWGSI